MYFQSLLALFQHYFAVFRTAWQLERGASYKHELAFLPAALELQDPPPHPAARWTVWVLISFLALALIWACLGQIDIVAVAPGKLVVSNQSKIVQALDTAVVKAIHVRDGQQVKAGQLLIELDNTVSDADSNHSAWLDARLAQLKAQALLSALAEQHLPILDEDPQLNSSATIATRRASAQQEINAVWQELQARLAMLDSEQTRKQAERAGSLDQLKKLQATLPIVRQRESDFKDLAACRT